MNQLTIALIDLFLSLNHGVLVSLLKALITSGAFASACTLAGTTPILNSDAPIGITLTNQGPKASVAYFGSEIQAFIEINSEAGSIEYDFTSSKGTYHVSSLVSSDARNAQFKASYREAGGRFTQASFTGNDMASPSFSTLKELSVDPKLLESGTNVLLSLPRNTENLKELSAIGLSLLEPKLKNGNQAIFAACYACEYWGCVIGGGGFQACGDVAYRKWGAN